MDSPLLVSSFTLGYGRADGITEDGGLSFPCVFMTLRDQADSEVEVAMSTQTAVSFLNGMVDQCMRADLNYDRNPEPKRTRRQRFAALKWFWLPALLFMAWSGILGAQAAIDGVPKQSPGVFTGLFAAYNQLLILLGLVSVVTFIMQSRRKRLQRRTMQQSYDELFKSAPLDGSHEAL